MILFVCAFASVLAMPVACLWLCLCVLFVLMHVCAFCAGVRLYVCCVVCLCACACVCVCVLVCWCA